MIAVVDAGCEKPVRPGRTAEAQLGDHRLGWASGSERMIEFSERRPVQVVWSWRSHSPDRSTNWKPNQRLVLSSQCTDLFRAPFFARRRRSHADMDVAAFACV